MDIKYQMAITVQGTNFMKKYGKNNFCATGLNNNIGFEKDKLRFTTVMKRGILQGSAQTQQSVLVM